MLTHETLASLSINGVYIHSSWGHIAILGFEIDGGATAVNENGHTLHLTSEDMEDLCECKPVPDQAPAGWDYV